MTDTTTTESTTTDQPATTDEPTLKDVCEQLDQLTDRVDELEAEVEQKDERIDELEAQLTEYKRFAGSEFADVRKRITDIEEQAPRSRLIAPTKSGSMKNAGMFRGGRICSASSRILHESVRIDPTQADELARMTAERTIDLFEERRFCSIQNASGSRLSADGLQ